MITTALTAIGGFFASPLNKIMAAAIASLLVASGLLIWQLNSANARADANAGAAGAAGQALLDAGIQIDHLKGVVDTYRTRMLTAERMRDFAQDQAQEYRDQLLVIQTDSTDRQENIDNARNTNADGPLPHVLEHLAWELCNAGSSYNRSLRARRGDGDGIREPDCGPEPIRPGPGSDVQPATESEGN